MGLASISAGVQRAGGSRQHPGAALDEALELRAASIEGGASGEALGMGTVLQESVKSKSLCILQQQDAIKMRGHCPHHNPLKLAYML